MLIILSCEDGRPAQASDIQRQIFHHCGHEPLHQRVDSLTLRASHRSETKGEAYSSELERPKETRDLCFSPCNCSVTVIDCKVRRNGSSQGAVTIFITPQ